MIGGIHIRDLDVFGYGFFQDILNLMDVLEIDELARQDVVRYRELLLGHSRKGNTTKRLRKRKPCKGCKDKEK